MHDHGLPPSTNSDSEQNGHYHLSPSGGAIVVLKNKMAARGHNAIQHGTTSWLRSCLLCSRVSTLAPNRSSFVDKESCRQSASASKLWFHSSYSCGTYAEAQVSIPVLLFQGEHGISSCSSMAVPLQLLLPQKTVQSGTPQQQQRINIAKMQYLNITAISEITAQ